MADKLVVTGARGPGLTEIARRTGNYGVQPTDSDAEALGKFADAAIQQNPGFKGDTGDTGPANSTYDSKAAVAAAPVTNKSYLLASSPFDGGYFQDLRGDYRTQVAADPNQVLFIPVAGDPTGAQGVRARVFSGPVDARWAKATGDGVTNDTAALVAADRVAAAFGKELFIPAGTYMIDPITATTNWRMERGTIIKYRGNGTGYIPLVTFENMTDPVVEGGTFDGNVSADPVNWATGYNTFTGASGLRFLNCTRPKAIRVNAQNCSWSGIQLTGCTNFTIDKCSTKRTRGNFGDGFLIISCVGGVVSDCVSTDYTRIGFVLDSFGEGSGIQTCRDITISGAKATNGHDGSALYGGAEFNVGIWCENSANISVIACFTAQNVHRGINLCTGPMPSSFTGSHASLTVTGCQTEGGSWGILTYSLNNFPVVSVVANCTVKKATLAFEGTAYNPTDAFSWVNCSAEYDASSPVGRGFATEVLATTGKPSFSVGSGCTVTRWQENMALLDAEDGSATTADVGTSITVNGPMRLVVDGLRHKQDKPIYAKWFGNYAHEFLAKNVTLKVPHGGSTGGTIKVEGGEVQSFLTPYGAAPYAAKAIIDGSVIVGRVWMRGVKTQVLNATVTLTGSDEVWLEGGTGTRKPTVEVKGSSFTKDLSTAAAGTAVIRVGDGSVDYGALFFANSFYNAGSTDGGRPFIRAAGSIVVSAAANLVDSSVTNIITRADGTSPVTDPTGFTRISMH